MMGDIRMVWDPDLMEGDFSFDSSIRKVFGGYKLGYKDQTGTFLMNDVITGATSGATATVKGTSPDWIFLENITGAFQDGEIIYGSALGGELVTDGDCSSDSFSIHGDGWAYDDVNDEYDCDGSQAANSNLIQENCLPDPPYGKFYAYSFTVKNYSAGSVALLPGGYGGSGWKTENGIFSGYAHSTNELSTTSLYVLASLTFVGSTDDKSLKQVMNAALASGTAQEYFVDVSEQDLESDEGLETAVVISLFTDRRAKDDDVLPDPDNLDRRGWWGDLVSDVEGDQIGSRLWLLKREKTMESVLVKAKEYAKEALAWFVEDGVAEKVEVDAERLGPVGSETLALSGQIHRPDGTVFPFKYEAQWTGQGLR